MPGYKVFAGHRRAGSVKLFDESAVHSISQQPECEQIEVLAQEVNRGIAISKKCSAGMPAERAVVGFDFIGQRVDLITREWETTNAADAAVDLVNGLKHHGTVVAIVACPDWKIRRANEIGGLANHNGLAEPI